MCVSNIINNRENVFIIFTLSENTIKILAIKIYTSKYVIILFKYIIKNSFEKKLYLSTSPVCVIYCCYLSTTSY